MLLRLRIFLASFLAFATLSVASAMTEAPRVAMIEPPSTLLDAMGVALSPWGLRVVPIAAVPPASMDIAGAVNAARVIAQEHNAAVVLWISAPAGAEPSLWLYEAQTEQVSVRPLPQAPPFDEASAAAVALTVKTLLRSTTVAPPKERLSPAPAPAALPDAGAGPSTPAATASATSVRADTAPTATSPPAPASTGRAPSEGHALRAETLVAAHLPTGTRDDLAGRAGLSVTYWPRPWRERFGFGGGVISGLNQEIAGASFTGSLSDTVVELNARGMLASEPFSLELAAGPSLHVTSLSGAIPFGRPASVQRGDPALDTSLVPQLSLGPRLRVGLFLGSSILLRTQRYTVGQDLVLKLPQVGFDLGGRASLALD